MSHAIGKCVDNCVMYTKVNSSYVCGTKLEFVC